MINLRELNYKKEVEWEYGVEDFGSSHIIEYLHYGGGNLSHQGLSHQGERIIYYQDGKIHQHGFCKNGIWFGKHYMYYSVSGLILEEYYSIKNPGELITEEEYRGELFLFRMGEIERPEYFYLLKDYRV